MNTACMRIRFAILVVFAAGISLGFPSLSSAETFTATASLSSTTASVGQPILASVDFGTQFTSIDTVCFEFTFQGDLLDPGDELTIIPLNLQSYGPGFFNPGPGSQSARTLCLPSTPGYGYEAFTSLFLDGSEDRIEISMDSGSVTIADLNIVISGTALAGPFAIINPKDSTQFPLTQSSNTATSPIDFEAGPIAAGDTVHWTAQLNYATSGGLGAFQDLRNFTTDSTSTTHNETYASIGGRATVQATETGNNPQSAQPITIYIAGSTIPDTDITNRLVSLYGGATPNLMTGIAVRESTYHQFITSSLFGVSALWPTESYDGGSHIGLMQMPVSKADAWDWLSNTADGVSLFVTGKLPFAAQLTNRIIASHPGLRQLTAVELEHMALVLYGPAASASLSKQYYAPARNSSGVWDWTVNTAGNPVGVAYANFIFSNLR